MQGLVTPLELVVVPYLRRRRAARPASARRESVAVVGSGTTGERAAGGFAISVAVTIPSHILSSDTGEELLLLEVPTLNVAVFKEDGKVQLVVTSCIGVKSCVPSSK